MTIPNGALGDAKIENRILAYAPERMLSIQVAKAPDSFPFCESIGRMWTVLYFRPDGEAKTSLRIVGLGFADDEASQKRKAFVDQANAFTQLRKRFAK